MRSPIDTLLDKVDFRCVKCGEKTCDCWAQVTLRCPKCRTSKKVQKDDTDPKGTATVVVICPKCDEGDFHECSYYDANGKPLFVG